MEMEKKMNRLKVLIFFSLFLFLWSLYFGMNKLVSNYNKKDFYHFIYRRDAKNTISCLYDGADPNICKGEAGWVDSIPLKVLSEGLEYTCERRLKEPTYSYKDDVLIFEALVNAGAKLNELPYVWDRVFMYGRQDTECLYKFVRYDEIQKKLLLKYFVEDVNRLLEAMLSAGADPNMKGHPFPFSNSRYLLFFNNKKAFKYFNSPEATTPLYEAIKKGSDWESQVDLLLEYGAALDESCLKAAELSGDEKMISKIRELMKQNIK